MNKNKASLVGFSLNYGIMIGLLSVIYSLILYFADQALNSTLGMVAFLILIVGLVLAMKNYRDQVQDGVLGFSQGLGLGVLVVLWSSLIGSIWSFLLMEVVDPGLQEKMIEQSIDKMMERGFSDAQIEASMDMMKKFQNPVISAITGFISSMLIGTVLSIIVAAIMKRSTPPQPEEQSG